jgi:glycosyltransferase involved in cell wall biosynthesis
MIDNQTVMVSVITTAYKEDQDYFRTCIESILGQTYSNCEFIIVLEPNDFAGIEFVKSFEDSRMKILVNEKKLGFVVSLNQAIKLSKGRYIARIDSDDYAAKYRLEKQVAYMEEHSECAVLGGALQLIDDNGNFENIRKYPLSFNQAFHRMSNCMGHPSVIIRKKVLDKEGIYNENFSHCEDLELWLRLVKKGYQLNSLENVLTYYRVPQGFYRKKENWYYDLKARWIHLSIQTISFRYLLTLVGFVILLTLPDKLISFLYQNRFVQRLKGVQFK